MTATMTNGDRATQKERAAELGVSDRTLRRWEKKATADKPKLSGNGHAPAPARVRPPAKPKPWWTRRRVMIAIASVACATVAAVTFWISYNHIRHLAELHGHAEVAGWLPLGVDGLVIACAASLVLESRVKKNPVAWCRCGRWTGGDGDCQCACCPAGSGGAGHGRVHAHRVGGVGAHRVEDDRPMNAWAFGTLVLIALIVVAGILLDRMADRGHAIRWEERFYRPELPVRRGPVRDVVSRPVRSIDR